MRFHIIILHKLILPECGELCQGLWYNHTGNARHKFVLTSGRYVGIKEEEDDGIPFDEKMKQLTAELAVQMEEEIKLNKEIKQQLSKISFQ